ncbi:MAG TPA: hypothetical protein VIK86_06380 [Candidatus Paceibacterota bacterium]
MEILKLEQLAPYLPYELKIITPYGFRPNGKESTGISDIVYLTGDLYADIENNTFKSTFYPILRPLSDLTKEIEVNGKKFVPIEIIIAVVLKDMNIKDADAKILASMIMYNDNIIKLPYWCVKILFELHFDVFNLISNGIAININTI